MNDIPQLSLLLSMQTRTYSILRSVEFANVFSFATSMPLQFLDTKSAEQLLVEPLKNKTLQFILMLSP